MDETVVDFELEGNGAPQGPPSLGKYGCTRARFGWEKGDDEAQSDAPSAATDEMWGFLEEWGSFSSVRQYCWRDRGEEAAAIKLEFTPMLV